VFNNEHQQWDLKYCCWGLVRQLDFRQEASVSNCVSIRARIATGISICPFKIENYGNGLVRHDARDTHSLHSTYTYRTYYRYCLYHRAIQYSTRRYRMYRGGVELDDGTKLQTYSSFLSFFFVLPGCKHKIILTNDTPRK
jgi:hypothetical protein